MFTNNENIVKKPPKLFGFKTPPSMDIGENIWCQQLLVLHDLTLIRRVNDLITFNNQEQDIFTHFRTQRGKIRNFCALTVHSCGVRNIYPKSIQCSESHYFIAECAPK